MLYIIIVKDIIIISPVLQHRRNLHGTSVCHSPSRGEGRPSLSGYGPRAVRYLLELHIGRRGHIQYNDIYFPDGDAGRVEARRTEPNATKWNSEWGRRLHDDVAVVARWSVVNGLVYVRMCARVGTKINKTKRKKIEWLEKGRCERGT